MLDFQLYRRPARRRIAHFANLARMGWTDDDIRAALRNSTTMQTSAEILCSVDMGEKGQKRVERKADAAESRLAAIAAKYGAKVEWSGDPRGCPSLEWERTAEGYSRSYGID